MLISDLQIVILRQTEHKLVPECKITPRICWMLEPGVKAGEPAEITNNKTKFKCKRKAIPILAKHEQWGVYSNKKNHTAYFI